MYVGGEQVAKFTVLKEELQDTKLNHLRYTSRWLIPIVKENTYINQIHVLKTQSSFLQCAIDCRNWA